MFLKWQTYFKEIFIVENHSSKIVPQSGHSNKLQQNQSYDQQKIDLIKRTICKDATDDEAQLFIQTCKRAGLDPFLRQIHFIKIEGKVISHVGVDGFRLIADRTGRYAPGKETEFTYDKQGDLHSAKAYVKKKTPDGVWHEVSAIAFFNEWVRVSPTWNSKRHIMLSKCAEMLALRKAFPAELSGLHVQSEDIPQEASKEKIQHQAIEVPAKLSQEDLEKLELLLSQFANVEEKTAKLLSFMKVKELKDIPKNCFEALFSQLENQLVSNG